jgi:hypothetical protein
MTTSKFSRRSPQLWSPTGNKILKSASNPRNAFKFSNFDIILEWHCCRFLVDFGPHNPNTDFFGHQLFKLQNLKVLYYLRLYCWCIFQMFILYL